jgi:dipeptidyl aminopeptidase/acylaminoacyl peptidase
MDTSGTGLQRVTENAADDDFPYWSPDGDQFAFNTNRDGNWEIYLMDTSGNGQQNITNNPADDFIPVWSPSGLNIVFESRRDGPLELYVMEASGNNQLRLTYNNSDNHFPDWSPDENQIIFCSNDGNDYELVVMNSDGTNQQFVTNNNFNEWVVVWRPTGSTGIGYPQDEREFQNGINLHQNYPNPFNPTTKISYQIPELSYVTLKIYDVLGKEIATLVSEEKPAGNYEINFNAFDVTSGIYFYQLETESYLETKKMILLK